MGDVIRSHLVGAYNEGFKGALDGRFIQMIALVQAFSQSDDTRKSIDDAKPVTLYAGNQQTAIIGSEIKRSNDGVGLAAPAAPALFGTAPARWMAYFVPNHVHRVFLLFVSGLLLCGRSPSKTEPDIILDRNGAGAEEANWR